MRRGVWNASRKGGEEDTAKVVNGARFALLRNPENLTDRQKEKLSTLEALNEPLYPGYLLKDLLRLVFATKGEEGVTLLRLRQPRGPHSTPSRGHRGEPHPQGLQRSRGSDEQHDPSAQQARSWLSQRPRPHRTCVPQAKKVLDVDRPGRRAAPQGRRARAGPTLRGSGSTRGRSADPGSGRRAGRGGGASRVRHSWRRLVAVERQPQGPRSASEARDASVQKTSTLTTSQRRTNVRYTAAPDRHSAKGLRLSSAGTRTCSGPRSTA